MARTFLKLSAACALALSLAACVTPGERAVGGAVVGGGAGAAIGAGVAGPQGALVGGLAGATTGAVVGAATAPGAARPPFAYEEYWPGCPDWRERVTVRSSSDAYTCVDRRGYFRPRRGLVEPRIQETPVLIEQGY